MSLSVNQITGRAAELEVEQLFNSWGWVVGTDHIDDGYDLLVMPDRALYKGARFSVQVKGEAKVGKKRSVTAPVAKNRLRHYAEDPQPVVIVRRTGNGKLYWVHAQAWAKANPGRLSGSGNAGVRMDLNQELNERESFEHFLKANLTPAAQRHHALAELAEDRRVYLNSLDTSLEVDVGLLDGRECFTIRAAAGGSKARIQFEAATGETNLRALSDAIRLGKPAEIQVEDVRSIGSPLLTTLGLDSRSSGTISIEPAQRRAGFIRLHAGERHTVSSPTVMLPAELFIGQEGVSVAACHPDHLMEMSADFHKQGARGGKVDWRFTWSDVRLSSVPIRDLTALRDWESWATSVEIKQCARIEFSFEGSHHVLPFTLATVPELQLLINTARTFGRLHLVADAVQSSFQLPPGYDITPGEMGDIDLAYALLKGETLPVVMGTLEFEAKAPVEATDYEILVQTTLRIEIGELLLAELPVKIELPDFKVVPLDGSPMHKLTKEGKHLGMLSLDDHTTVPRSTDLEKKIGRYHSDDFEQP
ncbi:DUF4365 domain-containing protein [Xanthomonas cannabis]|uniref:DUF4365 domain-containing protein n=1 Tax=Xanthomonas cannabis TaxID=1885674 RepID=A0ABR6JQ47_9XANT|nr:DUF4365 domain-containing protein [Xanthomonas cannabis]MBB4594833.1 hypothetical protein [Xanthomonas cannabis]MBB5523649.1 hypothetical protein [Xanthomonas cannabis]